MYCPNFQDSVSQADGTYRVKNADGEVVAVTSIFEVKEDWGQGGGSNPLMQLLSYYSMYVVEQAMIESPVYKSTNLPAIGIELFGNTFRCVCPINAL